jgi:hypothetical protein
MNYLQFEMEARMRHEELIQEAEHERLVARVRAGQPRWYTTLLGRARNLLAARGERKAPPQTPIGEPLADA